MKKLIAVLCFVFLSSFLCAQSGKFSSQKDAFIQDLGKFIRDSKSEPAKQELELFETFWAAGSLTGAHQKTFVKISNKLAKKRYKAYPHFSSLMQATRLAVDTQKVAPDVMDTLMFTFEKVVDEYKRPQYEFFFRTIIPFLERNTLNNGTKNDIVARGKFKIVWREKTEPVIKEVPEEEVKEEIMTAEDAWAEEEEDTGGEEEWGNWDSWDNESTEDEWTTEDAFGEEKESVEQEAVEETVIIAYIAPDLPEIKGPVIEFETVDFEFTSRYDSVALKQTKATFLIADRKVIGEGGTFDWTSTGLGEEVHGTFKQYVFPTNKIFIEAEGFTLNYDSKIDQPVEGIFMFASTKHSKPENAQYPRFMSYNADVTLKDLGENVKYTGGFSMDGRRVYSSCVSLANSKIEVFKNGHKMFVTKAVYFELGDSVITSNPSSVTMFFGGGQKFEKNTSVVVDSVTVSDSTGVVAKPNNRKVSVGPGGAPTDSIYHPSVRLKYNITTEKLSVYKNKSRYKQMPFVDTYHVIDIDVDVVYWTLSDTLMYFSILNGRKEVTAHFKSKDYFSEEDYVRLKGLYRFHPLQLLVSYCTKNDTKIAYMPALVKYSKQSESALNHAMMDMMHLGFVDYEPFSGRIKVKDKAFFFVKSRKFEVDYDVITIQSVNPGQYNARLSLVDNGMTIDGVDSVYFSDSLDVNFHPKDRRLTMYANRKMFFDGAVNTSIYNFNGRQLSFDYDKFSIDLVHIDSIKFTINTKDSITGRSKGTRQIDNKLSYSSGTLFIDSISNKSSKNVYPQYPYFDANRGAYVYFNQADILGGVYDTTVYFKIPPFDSDSMSSAQEKSVGFDGEFFSAGIFPPFEQKLVVMEDYSFGFEHSVPAEGYQTYGGDGVFFGTIRLDKQGLRGKGVIKYLNTVIESSDFIFYTDSLVAVGTSFVTMAGTNDKIGESVTFPQLGIENYEVKWYPKEDSMLVKNLMNSFSFYDSTATLTGAINISHKGMTGYGIFDRTGSRTVSPKFMFEQTSFTARDAEFEILSDVEGKPAVKSDFVKVFFQLDSGYAEFGPEKEGFAANEFPYLKYKTSINNGLWDFDKHTVTMSMPEGGNILNSYFYSTHPDQDSLVFNAKKAVYLMDSLSLYVTGVPEIIVADGKIIPDRGELFIKENALLDTLRNAIIVMDTVNEFHHLYDGTIHIVSRSKFTGNAKYSYVNLLGDSLYINFNSFDLVETKISKKKTEVHTVSHGVISEADTFLMAPKMYYRGEATMKADKRLLSLSGAIKLDMNGQIPSPNWLNYDKKDEVDQVVVKTEGQKTANGREPITGIHYSPTLGDYYVTFFGQKGGKKDFTIFKSEGVFIYDQERGEYLVGDSMKIIGAQYEGDLFAYHEEKELVRIQGLIDVFGHPEEGEEEGGKVEEVDHPVEATISAEGDMQLLDSTFLINGLTFLTYDYDLKALDVMGADLEKMSALYGIEQAYHFNDTLAFEIADIAGENAAQAFRENPSLPLPKVVKIFASGVVLTDVHLVWDKLHKAWYSKGRFGVGSVGKHQVNSMVTGYLEIRKGKGFNYSVNLYIELNDRVWYYLTFEQNKLLTVSSNTEYNEIITKKNTRAKNEVMRNYFFDLAPSSSKERFFKRFISTHLNGEGLEDLDIESINVAEEGDSELNEEETTVGEEESEEDEVIEDTEEELDDVELTDEEEEEFFEEMQDEVPADEENEEGVQDIEDQDNIDQGDFQESKDVEEDTSKKKKKKAKNKE